MMLVINHKQKNKTYHIMTYEEWVKLGKPVHCGLYIED